MRDDDDDGGRHFDSIHQRTKEEVKNYNTFEYIFTNKGKLANLVAGGGCEVVLVFFYFSQLTIALVCERVSL